jgi:eukaryotic-like serine/threonine-protein kinase
MGPPLGRGVPSGGPLGGGQTKPFLQHHPCSAVFLANPGVLLAAASGMVVAALGLLLLVPAGTRRGHPVFGLFALAWGLSLVCANLGTLATDAALGRLLKLLDIVFQIPLAPLLVWFAATYPASSLPALRRPAGMAALFLLPVVLTITLAASPGLFLEGVVAQPGGTLLYLYGPMRLVVVGSLVGSFFVALFLISGQYRDARSRTEATKARYVAAALSLYVAYTAPQGLLSTPLLLALAPAQPATWLVGPLLALGFVPLGVVAARLARGPADPALRLPGTDPLLLLVGAAAAAGLVGTAPLLVGGQEFNTLGVWRLLSVGLIVLGIARHQVFDLDLRLKHRFPVVVALVAAATAVLVGDAVAAAAAAPGERGPVVLAGAALLGVLGHRMAGPLGARLLPGVEDSRGYIYSRKVEVYRSSLEAVLSGGGPTPEDDAWLAELRRDLGLTTREHDLLLLLVHDRMRSRGLEPAPPAEGGPPAAGGATGQVSLAPGMVAFGSLRVVRKVAEGAFARVFLGHDEILQRPVAIKELQLGWHGVAEAREGFLQDAKVAGGLRHPNVAAVYAVHRAGPADYVVMEYAEGGSLEDRLQKGPIPLGEAFRVLRDALDGLSAVHARGILHRDLKPANILLFADGTAKLTDFGIAVPLEDLDLRTLTAQPGTLAYMSPEQAEGRAVDLRSDLYAVGAVAYRMVAGTTYLPFSGTSEFHIRRMIVNDAPRLPVAGLSPAWNSFLARALSKDPAHRFPDATSMRSALDALGPRAGEDPATEVPGRAPARRAPVRRAR